MRHRVSAIAPRGRGEEVILPLASSPVRGGEEGGVGRVHPHRVARVLTLAQVPRGELEHGHVEEPRRRRLAHAQGRGEEGGAKADLRQVVVERGDTHRLEPLAAAHPAVVERGLGVHVEGEVGEAHGGR